MTITELRAELAKRVEDSRIAAKHEHEAAARPWTEANVEAWESAAKWLASCRERERIARSELIHFVISNKRYDRAKVPSGWRAVTPDDSPNPVIATRTARDGGTVRFRANGMVDAVDGDIYSISPGFTSYEAFDSWLIGEMGKAKSNV